MRHLIVGASAAGMAAAEAIRKRDPTAEIILLSAESHPPYYRPLIPYLIYQGKSESEILREPRQTPSSIILHLNSRAIQLDPGAHTLTVAEGGDGASRGELATRPYTYDLLLLATGASPIRPPIPGLDDPGVFTLRTWEHAQEIAAAALGATSAVVLGAGRIGMKSAFALRHLGLSVTVVELLERIVPQQLDAESASIFAEAVANAGIHTILGHTLTGVNRRGNHVVSVTLDDGRELPADLVVVGVGVRPNLELAVSGGLSASLGLRVDAHLHTSAPDVFAAGDVVETNDIVTGETIVSGIWTNAVNMGRIAGDNMTGGDLTYEGAFSLLNAMELGGLPVISVGDIHHRPGGDVEIFTERYGSNYRKLVFQGNRLIGLVLVGAVDRAGIYQTLIREKADVSPLRRELLGPRFHYGHYIVSGTQSVDRYMAVG